MRKWIKVTAVAVSLSSVALGLTLGAVTSSGADSPNTTKAVAPLVNATYTLNPKAVLINAADLRFQTSDHTVAQQLTYTGSTPVVVGTIIVVKTTTGPFYGTVTAIKGNVLSTVPASLGDIFESLNLSMTATQTGSGSSSTPVGGAGASGASVASTKPLAVRAGKGSSSASATVAPLLSATCSGSISPSVTINVAPSGGTFVLDLNFSWVHGLKSGTLTDDPSFSVTASGAVSGSGSCTLSQPLFSVDLDPIVFAIGWVPVWITQTIAGTANLAVTADGSASINLGYKTQATLGVNKPQGGSWSVVHYGSVVKTVNTSVNINATATLDLPISYEAALYGVGGLGVDLDPFADLAVTVNPPVCKPAPWFQLTGGVNASIYALINFGSLYSWNHTFGTVNFFDTDLYNLQKVCPPTTTTLNLDSSANAIQSTFTPTLPSGNVLGLNSKLILQDVAGTTGRFFIAISDPNNTGTAFTVRWYQPQTYVFTHAGTYTIKIGGGAYVNGHAAINKQLTITVS